MSQPKQPKLAESVDYDLNEIVYGDDDVICAFNRPPPGVTAAWREIPDDCEAQQQIVDNSLDSSSEEEEYDQSEYFYSLSMKQYEEALKKEPNNQKLKERMETLKMSQHHPK